MMAVAGVTDRPWLLRGGGRLVWDNSSAPWCGALELMTPIPHCPIFQ